jgi:hypothetical protein
MSQTVLMRLYGAACFLGGLCLATFVLIHPWDQLLGAEVARTVRWRAAHGFHFIGAALTLLGLPGLYAQQRGALTRIGTIGFIVSLLGNAMFVGTGMITAFIWPMLALYAPGCIGVGGPIFGSPLSLPAFSLTAIFVVVGYGIFGLDSLRAGILPRPATLLLMIGAILGMLPPHPVGALPWGGLVLGGVLYGVGLMWLGVFLWIRNPPGRPSFEQAATSV